MLRVSDFSRKMHFEDIFVLNVRATLPLDNGAVEEEELRPIYTLRSCLAARVHVA